jgi:hypothetical protein
MLASPSPPLYAHSMNHSSPSCYGAPSVPSTSSKLAGLSLGPPIGRHKEAQNRRSSSSSSATQKRKEVEPSDDRPEGGKEVNDKGKERVTEAATPSEAVDRTPEGLRTTPDEDSRPLSPDPLPPALSNPQKDDSGSLDEEDETVDEEGQPRFVGNLSIRRDADEPILRDNKRRFVLFPIQYHEVRIFNA